MSQAFYLNRTLFIDNENYTEEVMDEFDSF